ncbi:MAG TPA: hypothetical protein VLO11_08745 [Luteolibacter sp.]|nr:hypothetical protein [Luteolibacter sp.]
MRDTHHVEDILARLMPPGLTAEGQRGIESMIDDLAGDARKLPRRWMVWTGSMAAALTAGWFVVQAIHRDLPGIAESLAMDGFPEFTLVSETGRIEDMIDEGWSETPDGNTMRTLRLHVVEESRLLDESTGIVMNISQPREEILLMPVSAF